MNLTSETRYFFLGFCFCLFLSFQWGAQAEPANSGMVSELVPPEKDQAEKNQLKVNKLLESYQNNPQKLLQETQGLTQGHLPAEIKNMKFKEVMIAALTPLRKMSDQEILRMLKEQSQNSKLQNFFEEHPKINLFRAHAMKDKEALPELASILDQRQRLIQYSVVMLATLLLGFIIKRFLHKKDQPLAVYLALVFARIFFVLLIRLGITIGFFGHQLRPMFNLIVQHFL